MNKLNELRQKYQRFIFERFDINYLSNGINISFTFLIEPDIKFTPSIKINSERNITVNKKFIFYLGMIEALSYWKSTCASEFIIKAGYLSDEEIKWWKDIYYKGLGEFFYINKIDLPKDDFLKFINASHQTYVDNANNSLSGDLILISGGKDSVVTLELLKQINKRKNLLLLNPTDKVLQIAKQAGFTKPIVVYRSIDTQLLKINKSGFLNGHTPFSAYLAFLSLVVADAQGYQQIIVSNESSASEGNVNYQGQNINHQYSKSFTFEKKFREYLKKINSQINYFSLLRPLNELQITQFLINSKQYLPLFVSCNKTKGTSWCGKCPKCAFVYLMLKTKIDDADLMKIFNKDLLNDLQLTNIFLSFIDSKKTKPFECVGTRREIASAVLLINDKLIKAGKEIPENLTYMLKIINKQEEKLSLNQDIFSEWNSENFLPSEYAQIVSARLNEIKL